LEYNCILRTSLSWRCVGLPYKCESTRHKLRNFKSVTLENRKPGKCTLCGQDVQDLARHVNADHTNGGQGIRDQDLMIRINRWENQIN
jgi:hypothetical protein